MKDSTKQHLNQIAADFATARQNNAPTYWMFLVGAGIFITGLATLIFKNMGLYILVTAAFVYLANNMLNAWTQRQQIEKDADEAEAKRIARLPKKPKDYYLPKTKDY